MRGVALLRVESIERNRLVTNDSGRAISLRRIDAMEIHVRLGPCHEESAGQVQNMKPLEIDVATIHDVDRAGLWHQQIEGMDVMQLAVGNVDEAGNVAAQVEQRMHLHRRLGRSEVRPREDRQAQVYGRGVQRINGVRQFQPQVLVGI